MTGIYEETLTGIVDHYSAVIEGGSYGGQVFNGIAGFGSSRPWCEAWYDDGNAKLSDGFRDDLVAEGSLTANRQACIDLLEAHPLPLYITQPDFAGASGLTYGKGEQTIGGTLAGEHLIGMAVRVAGYSAVGANNIRPTFSISALDSHYPRSTAPWMMLEGFTRLPDGIDIDGAEQGAPGGFDRRFWWTVSETDSELHHAGETMYLSTIMTLNVRFDRNHTHSPHQPPERYINDDGDDTGQAYFTKDRLRKLWDSIAALVHGLQMPNHRETVSVRSLTLNDPPEIVTTQNSHTVAIPFRLVYRLDGRFL